MQPAVLRQGSALGERYLQDLSLSWAGSVLGAFCLSCMAPSGSRGVPPHGRVGTAGQRVEHSRSVQSSCSLAAGQGEGASGSFCKVLLGM